MGIGASQSRKLIWEERDGLTERQLMGQFAAHFPANCRDIYYYNCYLRLEASEVRKKGLAGKACIQIFQAKNQGIGLRF